MGACLSCKSSSTFKNIRVVHLNGYVDFEHPVTVSQVTGKPTKHFLCTHAQLLSPVVKPMKPDTQLEPGHIYFLLPYSTIQSDLSPVELATIAKQLTSKASRSQAAKSGRTDLSSSPNGLSPIWGSPAASPNRFSDQSMRMEPESGLVPFGMQKSSKSRSWKPILATIRERSFNRRSESDLQAEPQLDTQNSTNKTSVNILGGGG